MKEEKEHICTVCKTPEQQVKWRFERERVIKRHTEKGEGVYTTNSVISDCNIFPKRNTFTAMLPKRYIV